MEELTKEILAEAIRFRVDDIYLLPYEANYRFYIREQSHLKLLKVVSSDVAERWISYMKYRAGMDVGEKRKPQSGSMLYRLEGGNQVEMRLSVMTNYKMQASMVIRLLHVSPMLTQEQEFMCVFPEEVKRLEKYLHYKSGLLLFSGPVSSGKTTTMYHLLRQRVKEEALQVITMEEPVEVNEPRFLQIEVNEKAGIDYELLIKSALRHHPDVMLIGEIRDEETAKMVVRGALTGHLMVATVHAKDCAGVVSRLEELGISLTLLKQTVVAIVAQRLVPLYCPLCQGECRLDCSHIPMTQKRATLFDIVSNNTLKDLLEGHWNEGDAHSFNRKLRKAYGLGYLTQKTVNSFYVF